MTSTDISIPYKSILIVGKDNLIPSEIFELYKRDGYLLIGDGLNSLETIDLSMLKDKIGQNTRIDIWAHGNALEGIHYIDIKTEDLLRDISSYSNHPIHVHLHSCYAGAAVEDVKALPVGSVLVCHGEDDKVTLVPNAIKAIKEANENVENLSPALDFANKILLNSKHTATFSKNNGSNQIFKFVARSKAIAEHPEVLKSPEDIVRYYREIQTEFINKYIQLGNTNDSLNSTRIHELQLSEAKVWAKDYFMYLIISQDSNLREALNNDFSNFKEFLNYIDHNNCTALHYVAEVGDKKTMKVLTRSFLEERMDLNKQDIFGNTPLHIAAKYGHLKIVDVLIEANALSLCEPNKYLNAVNNSGNTPLHNAVENGYVEVVKELINQYAKINTVNIFGNTPLHSAVIQENIEMVKELLEAGADINIVNKDGYTAYDITNNQHIKDLIKSSKNEFGMNQELSFKFNSDIEVDEQIRNGSTLNNIENRQATKRKRQDISETDEPNKNIFNKKAKGQSLSHFINNDIQEIVESIKSNMVPLDNKENQENSKNKRQDISEYGKPDHNIPNKKSKGNSKNSPNKR
jgi:ankyrin repeat protein